MIDTCHSCGYKSPILIRCVKCDNYFCRECGDFCHTCYNFYCDNCDEFATYAGVIKLCPLCYEEAVYEHEKILRKMTIKQRV